MPERCDRCIQTARYQAYLGMAGPLHFCGHHFNDHDEALITAGWDVREIPVEVAEYVSV